MVWPNARQQKCKAELRYLQWIERDPTIQKGKGSSHGHRKPQGCTSAGGQSRSSQMCRRVAARSEDSGGGSRGSLCSISRPGGVYVALLSLSFLKRSLFGCATQHVGSSFLDQGSDAHPMKRKQGAVFSHFSIYFWLHWVSITICGLSLAAESGSSSPMQVLGLLFLGPRALGHLGLGSSGPRAPELRPSSWGARA